MKDIKDIVDKIIKERRELIIALIDIKIALKSRNIRTEKDLRIEIKKLCDIELEGKFGNDKNTSRQNKRINHK